MVPPASPGGTGNDGPGAATPTDRLPIARATAGRSARPRARSIAVLPEPGATPAPTQAPTQAPTVTTTVRPVVTRTAQPTAARATTSASATGSPAAAAVSAPVAIGRPGPVARPAVAEADPAPDTSRRRFHLPAISRSTAVLLGVLAAVVLVAGGAALGRFTAPGAASPPTVTGAVESVSGDARSTELTVRTPDGDLVVFTATDATVGAPRAGGLDALRPGEQVVVDPELDSRGGLTARTVLAGP